MEENKANKWKEYFDNHLNLIACLTGVLALLCLFIPLFRAVPIVETENGFSFYDGGRRLFFLWDLLGGTVFSWGFFFAIVCIVLGAVFSFCFKFHKNFASAGLVCYLIGACFLLCTTSFYEFALSVKLGMDMGDVIAASDLAISAGLIVSAIVAFIGALLDVSLGTKAEPISVRDMAEIAMFVAVAVVADMFLNIDIGQTGGSFNFCIIPLFVIAVRHGPAKGFIAGGLIFGLITCLTDGYGIHYFPFDYMIGFGSIGVIGFFRKWIFPEDGKKWSWKGILFLVIAIVLSTAIRLVGGCTSSMLYYGYDFVSSFVYNIAYIGPTGALGLVALIALYVPLKSINKQFPVKA